jgi:YD repeat-containing protein
VFNRILFVLCAVAVATFALGEDALAQSGPCEDWMGGGSSSIYGFGTNGNNLAAGVYNCINEGDWNVWCEFKTANCPPPEPKEPCQCCCGGAGNGPAGNGPAGGGPAGSIAAAGRPINLATGNTYIVQPDIRVPGLGGGLAVVRTWNSAWPTSQIASSIGMFGANWRSTYEERVFVGSDHYVRYARGDGSYWAFGYGSGGLVTVAPANVNAKLTVGNTYTTLTFQNGEQRHFDNTSGSLIAIIDRNGNTTQLSYDSLGRLTTVTDPASRHLYFAYSNPSFTLLATGITSDIGISLSYSYDTQGRLSQVTQQDSSTLTFAYDSQSRITSVTDQNGKVIEAHTYDSESRGLTSSKAAGVEAVTVTYSNP